MRSDPIWRMDPTLGLRQVQPENGGGHKTYAEMGWWNYVKAMLRPDMWRPRETPTMPNSRHIRLRRSGACDDMAGKSTIAPSTAGADCAGRAQTGQGPVPGHRPATRGTPGASGTHPCPKRPFIFLSSSDEGTNHLFTIGGGRLQCYSRRGSRIRWCRCRAQGCAATAECGIGICSLRRNVEGLNRLRACCQ